LKLFLFSATNIVAIGKVRAVYAQSFAL